MASERDNFWMRRAIQLAETAARQGEVPVGALVVLNDQVIGEGFNQSITLPDPTAHAEVVALRAAAQTVGNYRLLGARLYVTLEPCMMCAGAMVHARVQQLIYGATDPKAGAVSTKFSMFDLPFLNHRVAHEGGVLAEVCGSMLSQFFADRR